MVLMGMWMDESMRFVFFAMLFSSGEGHASAVGDIKLALPSFEGFPIAGSISFRIVCLSFRMSLTGAGAEERPLGLTAQEGCVVSLAGFLAAATVCPFTAPLSALKAHAQFGSLATARSYWEALRQVGGVGLSRSALHGNALGCLHAAPFAAVQFGVYHHLRSRLGDPLLTHAHGLPSSQAFLAGAAAGATATVVVFPIEHLKTRISYENVKKVSGRGSRPKVSGLRRGAGIPGGHSQGGMKAAEQKSAWDTARIVLAREGWAGMYRGLTSSVMEAGARYGLTFMAYELLERAWGRPPEEVTLLEHFMSGAIAMAFAQTFVFPFDTIRKMVQAGHFPVDGFVRKVQNPTALGAVRAIVASSGLLGLWKGSTASMLSRVPYAGCVFALVAGYWPLGQGILTQSNHRSFHSFLAVDLGWLPKTDLPRLVLTRLLQYLPCRGILTRAPSQVARESEEEPGRPRRVDPGHAREDRHGGGQNRVTPTRDPEATGGGE